LDLQTRAQLNDLKKMPLSILKENAPSMSEPTQVSMSCPNGHPSHAADARFCIVCGVQVVVLEQPNGYPQPNQPAPMMPTPYAEQCRVCGGEGRQLDEKIIVCRECRWLRPLVNGYAIDCSAFQWAEDGKAMSVLSSIRPLNAAARAISDKVGRRWVETTFNGVLLGDNQLPEVYALAVRAARVLGMTHMPDVYISGERTWDCLTFGSDKDAFVVVGSALATNFRGPDLLFLLAREMGHCRAGHALWKTVIRFLLGEQGPRKGLMSGGLFAALSPTALVEGALEMPLLAWARQAEITADRAGLLAVGDEEVARRVLLSWSLKSSFLYRQINIEVWLEQQAADDDGMTKLSELTTSSTPYITRRLRLLTDFARSPDLQRWQAVIKRYAGALPPSAPAPDAPAPRYPPPHPAGASAATTATAKDGVRVACPSCRTSMRVPSQVLEGKQQLNVRCPNAQCGKVTTLKKKSSPALTAKAASAVAPTQTERNLSDGDE
jgi:Zn-dependent protease with chaperone function